MPNDDNDPMMAAMIKAPPSLGFTDRDRAELVDLARTISKRDFGQGIAKMPREAVQSLIAIAIKEREAERARKAAAPTVEPEVISA